jgi:hypothetical protein
MPQLDLVSFFSQIFWFLLFFYSFYFIFLNKVVSYFGSCIKIRNKKLIKSSSISNSFNSETVNFSNDYNNLFKNSIQASTFSFTQAFTSLNSNLKKAELSTLSKKKTNKGFLKKFGSFIAVKNLIKKYL